MRKQELNRRSRSAIEVVKVHGNVENMEQRENERPAYQDKSLDMRRRLELWRAEKRKHFEETNVNKLTQKRWNPSTRYDCMTPKNCTAAYPPLNVSKSSSKKCKTPITKDVFSPSKRGTYKDPKLTMRTRLDLWLKKKGKTPQRSRLTSERISKARSATPAQRRKTWSFPHDARYGGGMADGGTAVHHGILKARSFTDRKAKKSCSFLLYDKENVNGAEQECNLSPVHPPRSVKRGKHIVQEDVLRQSLEKCLRMLNEEFREQDEIVFTLDDIQRDHPNAVRHALYWICRAKLAENVGDHDRVVCMFEQAVAFSAQPEEKIKSAFNEYKTRKQHRDQEENRSPTQNATCQTPHKTPSRELVRLDGEVFPSSVVRFCLMDSTPFRKRRKSTSEKQVLTPVRRTTRWERCGITHPKTIEEKSVTVASLDELSNQLKSNLVFRPNSLLPCDLDKELLYLQDEDEF